MKHILISILILTILSCTNRHGKNEIKGLIIDPKIELEAEKHFDKNSKYDIFKGLMQVYSNSIDIEEYKNDTLIFKNKDLSKKIPFKSFYFWKKDTLEINGAYGLFEGSGFSIKIAKNKAALYHLLSSDEYPTYSYTKNDSLIMRLEIPCTDTKIILSKIPNPTENQIIYGYVEFKSNNFFVAENIIGGNEIPKKKKVRNNMKIYFKSEFLKITE